MRKMKPSGVEWIGEIPQEWEVKKIKHSFIVFSGATPKSEVSDNWDGDIPWITPADFKTEDKYVSKGRKNLSKLGYNSCGTTLVPTGSIVFSKRAPVGTVALTSNDLCTNQGCLSCVCRDSSRINTTYYYYVMSVFTEQFELVSTGTTFKEIAVDVFSNFILPCPDFQQQNLIAEFLDRKCAEIDSVISKTKATIEQYKALKQSVITQAVTKGIRPDRPMKESGIEWIGEIPQEWKISKLKYLCQMQAGKNLTSEEITSNGEYPVYGGNGIRGYYNEFNTVGNHLLVGRQGALCGNIHKVEGYFWATEHCVVTLCSQLSYRDYLYYLLIAMNLNQYASNTAAQPGLSVNMIQNVSTCIVPIDEQQEIANYLDRKCAEIDRLIAAKEQFHRPP